MLPMLISGGVTERLKVAVLKTVVQRCTGGSNPSSSASKRHWQALLVSAYFIGWKGFTVCISRVVIPVFSDSH